ncbi:MAG: histidine kinase [Colwellia sp.]|nr:histidine kinase [Colwellia sp.]
MAKPTKKFIKLKSAALLSLAIWLGLALFALLSQISSWLTSHHFEPNFFSYLRFYTLKIWLPWLVLIPIVQILATKFPVKPKKWLTALLLHAFFLLSLSLISALMISLHYHFFEEMPQGMKTYQPWQHMGHFLFGDNFFLFNVVIYTLLVTAINIKHFANIAQQKALVASQLNNQLIESQLQTLKMQINPHFLFNTLNVISVLVMKSEQAQATTMINRLSNFFRATLDDKAQQWITLEKELAHVEQYLAIEQVRFGDRININKNYHHNTLPTLVPSMILQPLIENAMQHGLEEKQGKVQLTINSYLEDNALKIELVDDGAGCDFNDKRFKEGIGLSNVRSRLQQLYGRNFQFTLSSNTQGGVSVSLTLPINHQESKL